MNRTPVVRVTGGNTKPLYYFGPIRSSIVDIMRRRKGKEGNGWCGCEWEWREWMTGWYGSQRHVIQTLICQHATSAISLSTFHYQSHTTLCIIPLSPSSLLQCNALNSSTITSIALFIRYSIRNHIHSKCNRRMDQNLWKTNCVSIPVTQAILKVVQYFLLNV